MAATRLSRPLTSTVGLAMDSHSQARVFVRRINNRIIGQSGEMLLAGRKTVTLLSDRITAWLYIRVGLGGTAVGSMILPEMQLRLYLVGAVSQPGDVRVYSVVGETRFK
jgi:hypothetical protein